MARVKELAEHPPLPRGTLSDQIRDIREYLYRTMEEAAFLLTHLDEENLTEAARSRGGARIGSITLTDVWSGDETYTQPVSVRGAEVTARSKVDLQPTAEQLESLIAAHVLGLVIQNDGGRLTACAVGAAPEAMTIQCTVEDIT